MSKFKVGDLVRGVNSGYPISNSDMTKAEVIKVFDNGSISFKILEHKEPEFIGQIKGNFNPNDLELITTKPTKSDLNSSMLFKLRGYGLCAMLTEFKGLSPFYNKNYIQEGHVNSLSNIEENYTEYFKANVKGSFYPEYDIIAIKQFDSQNQVIHAVLNDIEPEQWDWQESDDIRTDRIQQLDAEIKDLKLKVEAVEKVYKELRNG